MGGHGVVQCGFYGGVIASWCVEGHCFFPVFVQLSGFVQPPPFGPSMV